MEELLKELKAELSTHELIDVEQKTHYNLITTDICYDICEKYLRKYQDNING
jgi:RNA-binding protein YhbY